MSPRHRLVVAGDRADADEEGVVLVETVRTLVEGLNGLDRDVTVLLVQGGPLVEELATLAPVIVVADLDRRSRDAVAERVLFALRLRRAAFRRRRTRLGLGGLADGDAVYLHSVLAVQVLRYLDADGPRVVCRLPRSLEPLRWGLGKADQSLLLDRVDRFVAERGVRVAELLGSLDVPPERVVEVPEVILPTDPRAPRPDADTGSLRSALDLDEDAFLVGGYSPATTADPPDLSVFLASLLTRRAREVPITCLWVITHEAVAFWIEHDVDRTGVADAVRIVHSNGEMEPQLRLCDVLVHLTRIDAPASLNYLEVAADGVPIVCFTESSLTPFVQDGTEPGEGPGGITVGYLDVLGIADAIARLCEDPELRRRLGRGAAARIADVHSVARFAERLVPELGPGA